MVIWQRLLVVVDGGEGVQGACYLEDFLKLILEKLLATAVVVEAEARQIKESFLDSALRVHIVVNVV